jgi:hypothetical protein
MTEFQRLIDDLEELKSTKLYTNSFKAIDDCIHLLYSRKNYFEELERISTNKDKSIYVVVSYVLTDKTGVKAKTFNFIGLSFDSFPTINDIKDSIKNEFNIEDDEPIRISSFSKLSKEEYNILWSNK